MDASTIRKLLEAVRKKKLPVEDALARLRALPPFEELDGFATVDHHRALRKGHPEIVYGPGKTPAQAAAIAKEIVGRSKRVLVTRVDAAQARAIRKALPKSVHHKTARAVTLLPGRKAGKPGIVIVSAGTADQTVADEARVTCRFLGQEAEHLADVGVAGIHRLLRKIETLQRARVVIAVAGMEGALASVVGGLVAAPVIAVPTSIGYGAGAGGIAALLAMLNSCASNVCVVNIDNGVGAAVVASRINDLDT